MLRKIGGLSLAFWVLLSQQASAETYEISLMGPGFFPIDTYTQVGDVIIFHNLAETAATISAVDGSWTTGTIEPQGNTTLTIVDGMTSEFENSHASSQYTEEEIADAEQAEAEAEAANETSETFIDVPAPLVAKGSLQIGVEIPIVSAGDGEPITSSEASLYASN